MEIASPRFHQDTGLPEIPVWREPPADPLYPLRMITPKSAYRVHSQGSNLPAIQAKAKHALEMHPQDAAARGLLDGCLARLFNSHGETRVPVLISEDVIPGVVCLHEGVWAELDEDGIDRAGSANLLTGTEGTQAGTACIMHGVPVEVGIG